MSCPICGSANIKKKFQKYDDRYGCPGIFEILKCSECGHHFIADMVNFDVGRFYTEYYPRRDIKDTHRVPVFKSKNKFVDWLDGKNASAFRNVPEKVKVLDIGCGDCTSLFYLQSKGCRVTGIEADGNVAFLKSFFGDELIISEFSKELFENESFDYVTMDQVVEHFADSEKKLREIKCILKENGRIVLTTPNSSGWGVKLFGKYWINWHSPYHLNLFTKKSIKIVLERSGFKNIEIKTVTSSSWLNFQWNHLLFYPEYSSSSKFWLGLDTGSMFIKLCINILHTLKINHIITRIFDALGIGDNILVTAEKDTSSNTADFK